MEILKNLNLQWFISLIIAVIMTLPLGFSLLAFFYRTLIKPSKTEEIGYTKVTGNGKRIEQRAMMENKTTQKYNKNIFVEFYHFWHHISKQPK